MIYTMADLHLPSSLNKNMNMFGEEWTDHKNKIKENWNLKKTDTIVIPGDLSWGLKINEIVTDFEFLDKLSGNKIIIKGNHDYWWNSKSKAEKFLEQFNSIKIIQNNSIIVEDIFICGTRGWDINSSNEKDIQILLREAERLKLSLNFQKHDKKIVFFHYPPILKSNKNNIFKAVLEEYSIKSVYYGHLHGKAINDAIQGNYRGIEYTCVAGDQINFTPILIVNT